MNRKMNRELIFESPGNGCFLNVNTYNKLLFQKLKLVLRQ